MSKREQIDCDICHRSCNGAYTEIKVIGTMDLCDECINRLLDYLYKQQHAPFVITENGREIVE
jgi:ribosome-binding protein aMBF1 (putative translation factor)